MASEINKKKTRKRLATEIYKERDKKRKNVSRYLRSKLKRFTGWTKLGEKNSVKTTVTEKLDIICVDCGALMFPWEAKKKKGGRLHI